MTSNLPPHKFDKKKLVALIKEKPFEVVGMRGLMRGPVLYRCKTEEEADDYYSKNLQFLADNGWAYVSIEDSRVRIGDYKRYRSLLPVQVKQTADKPAYRF